jgi:hypothetical protein
MVIDYFNGHAHLCSLGIASQIKIMGEPLLILSGLWFDCLWLPLKKIQEFEDIEDLLVFFRLYFVIVGASSCISTMYYLLL